MKTSELFKVIVYILFIICISIKRMIALIIIGYKLETSKNLIYFPSILHRSAEKAHTNTSKKVEHSRVNNLTHPITFRKII